MDFRQFLRLGRRGRHHHGCRPEARTDESFSQSSETEELVVADKAEYFSTLPRRGGQAEDESSPGVATPLNRSRVWIAI